MTFGVEDVELRELEEAWGIVKGFRLWGIGFKGLESRFFWVYFGVQLGFRV